MKENKLLKIEIFQLKSTVDELTRENAGLVREVQVMGEKEREREGMDEEGE